MNDDSVSEKLFSNKLKFSIVGCNASIPNSKIEPTSFVGYKNIFVKLDKINKHNMRKFEKNKIFNY